MSYMNRVWAATGVAAVNSLSDQGQKMKSGFKSLNYSKHRFFSGSCSGPDAADLCPLSAVVCSEVGGFISVHRRGDGERERTEESLRQVLYLNCCGQG